MTYIVFCLQEFGDHIWHHVDDLSIWIHLLLSSRVVILCDPMDCSMPGFPVLHYLPEFAQTHVHWASLVAQRLKASACNARDLGLSLGWEDPLKKEMATHSSILAWRILWTEEPGGLQSMGLQRVGHN